MKLQPTETGTILFCFRFVLFRCSVSKVCEEISMYVYKSPYQFSFLVEKGACKVLLKVYQRYYYRLSVSTG